MVVVARLPPEEEEEEARAEPPDTLGTSASVDSTGGLAAALPRLVRGEAVAEREGEADESCEGGDASEGLDGKVGQREVDDEVRAVAGAVGRIAGG